MHPVVQGELFPQSGDLAVLAVSEGLDAEGTADDYVEVRIPRSDTRRKLLLEADPTDLVLQPEDNV